MNGRYLAVALGSALVASATTSVLNTKAAPQSIDLLDPTQGGSAQFRAWRDQATQACEQRRVICDALRTISDGAERMHVDNGMTATLVERGHYLIEHPARSGNPAVTVDLRVPDPPDAGPSKKTP